MKAVPGALLPVTRYANYGGMPELRMPMSFPEDWSGFGPRMQALNERARRFCWAYLINSMTEVGANGSQSARDAGFSDAGEGCKVRAHEMLHREDVQAAIQELAVRELRGLALPALAAVSSILRKPDHPDRQKVALSVLSRIGLGEQSGMNINVSGEVTLNQTDQALADLRQMILLNVPEEKLVEMFGVSGLPRYRKMLAEQDGKGSSKLIEGEVLK